MAPKLAYEATLQPASVRKKIRNICGLESSAMIAWGIDKFDMLHGAKQYCDAFLLVDVIDGMVLRSIFGIFVQFQYSFS